MVQLDDAHFFKMSIRSYSLPNSGRPLRRSSPSVTLPLQLSIVRESDSNAEWMITSDLNVLDSEEDPEEEEPYPGEEGTDGERCRHGSTSCQATRTQSTPSMGLIGNSANTASAVQRRRRGSG